MRSTDPCSLDLAALDIAVAIPCLNEELTIADLVDRIDEVIPTARIYVMDNGSTDETARRAEGAGAEVISVPCRGKGNAVAAMFGEIDADVLVMMDGDATYDPRDIPRLIERLIVGRCDMVVGVRSGIRDKANRAGSAPGNRLFNSLYRTVFGADNKDIFSGYRVFSRRFVRSFPALSNGLEIEADLTIHAQLLRLPVEEVDVPYSVRPEASVCKRSTVRDSIRITAIFMMLLKEVRPFFFFSVLAGLSLGASALIAAPVITEFYQTGLVARLPTAVIAAAIFVMSLLFFICGLVLDSIAKGRLEMKRAMSLLAPRISACDLEISATSDAMADPDLSVSDLPGNVTRLI
jgi:glycosyltransferase involved in cell wall biosynthesis